MVTDERYDHLFCLTATYLRLLVLGLWPQPLVSSVMIIERTVTHGRGVKGPEGWQSKPARQPGYNYSGPSQATAAYS